MLVVLLAVIIPSPITRGCQRFLAMLQRSIDVQIDTAHFPLVWMQIASSSGNPAAKPFSEFEALLARKEAFVLLNEEGLDRGEHEHSPEEMKQVSLWMKRHKRELRTFVKAVIYVEPSSAQRLATKLFTLIYEKFWGYPMLMVATRDEALALARRLLAGEQVDTRPL